MGRAEFRDEISPWSAQSAAVSMGGRITLALCFIVSLAFFTLLSQFTASLFFVLNYICGTTVILIALLRFAAIGWILRADTDHIPEQILRKPRVQIWPRYTILVPIYKEAHMVRKLMHSLEDLDYPKSALDIIMITEANDPQTTQMVKRYLRPPFRLFETPTSFPQTKPKALNAALANIPKHLIGDYVTIYDAEDRPHPLQLKAAIYAFENDECLAAVQAPLSFHNDKTNHLTTFFGLEYAGLFEVWNPALTRLGIPFTLGGTSNHIRRNILDRIGGWDAYNVTEDADLSFKINALSVNARRAKIGTIKYGTEEEIVDNIPAWMTQRSRWLKGFMQTWAIHKRARRAAPDGSLYSHKSKISRTVSLPITIGAALLFSFIHVPSLIILGYILACNFTQTTEIICPPIFYIGIIFGYSSAILMNIVGAYKAKKPYLIKHALFMPVYWLLYFPAALIALWEYIYAPSYWRKTNHKGNERKSISNKLTPEHLAAE